MRGGPRRNDRSTAAREVQDGSYDVGEIHGVPYGHREVNGEPVVHQSSYGNSEMHSGLERSRCSYGNREVHGGSPQWTGEVQSGQGGPRRRWCRADGGSIADRRSLTDGGG